MACSEQNQSSMCVLAHSKSPEDRLRSSEEWQLHVLNNAIKQPAANSNEDEVTVQTFLFPYRIALISVAENRVYHPGCF